MPGGWQELQWNFSGPFGVNAPAAWDNVERAGRRGGSGVVVAVLDTGVAYSDRGRFVRSPDLRGDRFVHGYDFVGRDRYPNDYNGHGTHVASTIAESIDNGVGVTGIAFGAQDHAGAGARRHRRGRQRRHRRGIRFAARAGVDIINLSFEFGRRVRARQIPDILDALALRPPQGRARRRGLRQRRGLRRRLSGARGRRAVRRRHDRARLPRRATRNYGPTLDLVAPGGGRDAPIERPELRPADAAPAATSCR